jgi:hypothetical protein
MTLDWMNTLSSQANNTSQWKNLKSSHWLTKSSQLTSWQTLWDWTTPRRALWLSAQWITSICMLTSAQFVGVERHSDQWSQYSGTAVQLSEMLLHCESDSKVLSEEGMENSEHSIDMKCDRCHFSHSLPIHSPSHCNDHWRIRVSVFWTHTHGWEVLSAWSLHREQHSI